MPPDGVIIGRWGYVIAAYAVTAVGLLIYAWSLRRRLKSARQKDNNG